MDRATTFTSKDINWNLWIRSLELIACTLCLIFFVTLVCLCEIRIFISPIIIAVAVLTIIIVIVSIIKLNRLRKKFFFSKIWLFFVAAAALCYIACAALFIIQTYFANETIPLMLIISLWFALFTAIIFLFDVFYTLRKILSYQTKPVRRHRVKPAADTILEPVQKKSLEQLPETAEISSEIQDSVIFKNPLTYNQEPCDTKWEGSYVTRKEIITPAPKLIYVQPCTSAVVSKICPGCRKFNCEKCYKQYTNDKDTELELDSQNTTKCSQFPENKENICPLCTLKPIKIMETKSAQTSDLYLINPLILPKLEEIPEKHIERSIHHVKIIEKPSRTTMKSVISSDVTPRKNLESQMMCPKCQKKNKFTSKFQKHFCPVCYQECENKLTCSTCFYDVFVAFLEEDKRESTIMKANEKYPQITEISPNEEYFVGLKKEPQLENNRLTQDSAKEHQTRIKQAPIDCITYIPKHVEDKFIQVSSTEFTQKIEQIYMRDANSDAVNLSDDKQVQVTTSDFKMKQICGKCNRSCAYQCICNVCNKDVTPTTSDEKPIVDIVVKEYGAEKIERHFENKLTQVTSIDFEKEEYIVERKPCGDPDCKHGICRNRLEESPSMIKGTEEESYGFISRDEEVQTEEAVKQIEEEINNKICLINDKDNNYYTNATPEKMPLICRHQETLHNSQKSCQTTQSLENVIPQPFAPEPDIESLSIELPTDLPACVDSLCTCKINDNNEILVCPICDPVIQSEPKGCQTTESLEDMNHQSSHYHAQHTHNCKCSLQNCICCNKNRIDERIIKEDENEIKKHDRCYCILTEKGLLICSLCEIMHYEKMGKQRVTSSPQNYTEDKLKCSGSRCLIDREKSQEYVQNITMYSNITSTSDLHKSPQHLVSKIPATTKETGPMEKSTDFKRNIEDEEHNNKSSEEFVMKVSSEKEDDENSSSISLLDTISSVSINTGSCSTDKSDASKDIKTLYKNERSLSANSESFPDYFLNKNESSEMYLSLYSSLLSEAKTSLINSAKTLDEMKNRIKVNPENIDDASECLEKIQNYTDDLVKPDETDNTKHEINVDIVESARSPKFINVWKDAEYINSNTNSPQNNVSKNNLIDQKETNKNTVELVETTQSEMHTIYNCMIKNLEERQIKKEDNLFKLQNLNCVCINPSNVASKHQIDKTLKTDDDINAIILKEVDINKEQPSENLETPIITNKDNESIPIDLDTKNQDLSHVKDCSIDILKEPHQIELNNDQKLNINTHIVERKEKLMDLVKIKDEKNSAQIILEDVSLLTISEERNSTPSQDVVSISQETKELDSKPQISEESDTVFDPNQTFSITDRNVKQSETAETKDKQEIVELNVIKKLDDDTQQNDNTEEDDCSTRSKTEDDYSKSGSARSIEFPVSSRRQTLIKDTGFFEPNIFYTPRNESVKANTTLPDDRCISVILSTRQMYDSIRRDCFKKLYTSAIGESSNFGDESFSNNDVTYQSYNAPITSRKTVSIHEKSKENFSFPCTPKKTHWKTKSVKHITEETVFDDCAMESEEVKTGRNTYRKKCDYDEISEHFSLTVLKNASADFYEMQRNHPDSDIAMQRKLVPPLSIASISPDLSESEDSHSYYSKSWQHSASTIQTKSNSNLECISTSSTEPQNSTCVQNNSVCCQERSASETQFQPISICSMAENSFVETLEQMQLNIETLKKMSPAPSQKSTVDAKRNARYKTMGNSKCASARIVRQPPTYICNENKRKNSAIQSTSKKTSINTDSIVTQDSNCTCLMYKLSRTNYCKVHGAQEQYHSVPSTQRNAPDCSKSCKNKSKTPPLKKRKILAKNSTGLSNYPRNPETSPKKTQTNGKNCEKKS